MVTRTRPFLIASSAVYWMLHLALDPAATGAVGVMVAVPLPAPAIADTHAATESTVSAPRKSIHLGVKRRGRITTLSIQPGRGITYRAVRTAASARPYQPHLEGKVGAKQGPGN